MTPGGKVAVGDGVTAVVGVGAGVVAVGAGCVAVAVGAGLVAVGGLRVGVAVGLMQATATSVPTMANSATRDKSFLLIDSPPVNSIPGSPVHIIDGLSYY